MFRWSINCSFCSRRRPIVSRSPAKSAARSVSNSLSSLSIRSCAVVSVMGFLHYGFVKHLGQADAAVLNHAVGDGLSMKRCELVFARAAGQAVFLLAKPGGFQHFG